MSHTALKTASLFLICGLVWLAGYNRLLVRLTTFFPRTHPGLLQYFMNAAFIAVSAVLIYLVIRHDFSRNNAYFSQYRHLFYEHPVPMWIYQWGTLKFLAVNDAAAKKYGYTRKEFEKMDILSIRDPSSIPAVLADVNRTNKNIDYRGIWQHKKKNGELFYVELYSHYTRYNGKEARIVMAIDIDSEVRSTIRAKDIGTRYELLAQVTQDCIYY
ncbi:PAS domain-containing protein [Chitinophaga barathri]|uniref:PAS domain S-box protein n=1 Tax=Chitinophaga barathri TaxID=1647451 RepID=A0A3N4M9B6_9BACT|nr:PAS domain-containing protein [Chitinophaga barathri]RPD40101.1 PAS domain S-box protein [Chitinophaga barathri]